MLQKYEGVKVLDLLNVNMDFVVANVGGFVFADTDMFARYAHFSERVYYARGLR